MSLPLGGFGKSTVDAQVGSLKCADMQILDKKCNLNARGADFAELRLRNDLLVSGNLMVCGEISGKTKLEFGDTVATGRVFDSGDQFTTIHTFEGSGNTEIEVLPGMLGTGVIVTKCPCNGTIGGVHPASGNIMYVPAGAPPSLDVFQYSALDECAVPHLITQFVCHQNFQTPPLFNNGACLFNVLGAGEPLTYFIEPLDLKPFVISSSPIDWSTLTFKTVTSFTRTPTAMPAEIACPNASSLTYPFNNSPLFTGPGVPTGTPGELMFTGAGAYAGLTILMFLTHDNNGVVTMTVSQMPATPPAALLVDSILRVTAQVSDVLGSQSNCGTFYMGVGFSQVLLIPPPPPPGMTIAPILADACSSQGAASSEGGFESFPVILDLNTVLTLGSNPIDWSTLNIKTILGYGETQDTLMDAGPIDCSAVESLPFGTFDGTPKMSQSSARTFRLISQTQTGPNQITWEQEVTVIAPEMNTFVGTVLHDGSGLLTFSFPSVSVNGSKLVVKLEVQVQDTLGFLSNCACIYLSYGTNVLG